MKQSNSTRHNILSSIFYYFLVQLNWLWNIILTVVLAIIQAMKIYQFPYTDQQRDFTMTAPFLLFVICAIKLYLAKEGNRGESPLYIGFAILFSVGCLIMDGYFISMQAYRWSWELPFHIVSIVFEACIFLFSWLMLIIFLVNWK